MNSRIKNNSIGIWTSEQKLLNIKDEKDILLIYLDRPEMGTYPYIIKVLKNFIPKYYYIMENGYKVLNRYNTFQPYKISKFMRIYESIKDLLIINNIKITNLDDNDFDEIFQLYPFQKVGCRHYSDGRASLWEFNCMLKKYLSKFEGTKKTIDEMDANWVKYIKVNKEYLDRAFNIDCDIKLMEKEIWSDLRCGTC